MQPSNVKRLPNKLIGAVAILGAMLLGLVACTSANVSLPSLTPSLPASTSSPSSKIKPTLTLEEDVDMRMWGEEITLDQLIQMAKRGEVAYIEWVVDTDRLRITTKAAGRYNYRNAKTKLDIAKVLQQQGIVVGDEGIPIEFYP